MSRATMETGRITIVHHVGDWGGEFTTITTTPGMSEVTVLGLLRLAEHRLLAPDVEDDDDLDPDG